MKIFIVVIIAAIVIGGFVGAELMGGDFSITGAVIGGVGTFSVLMGLGAFFDAQEKKKQKDLPPEIRGVFDRMLGQHTPQSRSAPKSKRKPNIPHTNKKDTPPEDEYISIAEKLITVQLLPKYSKPRDSFPSLMTNKNASGYVFGFHDALLQRLGFYTVGKKEKASKLIELSYKNMFGEQAGFALYSMSLNSQDDSEFEKGRMNGGNEIVAYLEEKVPPLGLGRILILGSEA